MLYMQSRNNKVQLNTHMQCMQHYITTVLNSIRIYTTHESTSLYSNQVYTGMWSGGPYTLLYPACVASVLGFAKAPCRQSTAYAIYKT